MIEVLCVGSAHAIFVSLFIFSKETKTLSDKLLSVWMLFLAMPMISRALSPDMLDISIPFTNLNFVYPLTFGPFLYLYTQSLVGNWSKLKRVDFIHFLPFILTVFYSLLTSEMMGFPHTEEVANHSVYMSFVGVSVVISLIGYSGLVIWKLGKHYTDVFNHFSLLSSRITLRWLTWVTAGFVVTYSLPLIDSIISVPHFLGAHGVAFTAFIFILSFYGLKQTQIYSYPKTVHLDAIKATESFAPFEEEKTNTNKASEQGVDSKETKNKYQRSGLDQARSLIYLKKLEHYMQQEKPYLDADLTIEKLAKALEIPRHYLTQVISEQLQMNFYLYVNRYRIKAIKEILNDPAKQQMTLIDIALISGFNSKSTFNKVFKAITQMTPSQYKKTLI